ncbi:MAG: hypothetical protein ABFS03_05425 [Chloroflexota bacterium]
MAQSKINNNTPDLRILLRNFFIELTLYGILVVGYFLICLRYINDYLTNMFHNNLVLYAFVALILIVAQGILLEWVTSFLLDQFKLDRLD